MVAVLRVECASPKATASMAPACATTTAPLFAAPKAFPAATVSVSAAAASALAFVNFINIIT